MGQASLLATATKSSIAASATLLIGLGLLAGFLVMTVALLRAAATGAEARSRGDAGARLRALDELVSLGSMKPDDYAARQAALFREN